MAGIITNLYDGLDDAWRYESDYGSYRDDVPLIHELAVESGGPVLEIGAGTGRIAIHLAQAGFDVTAIEKSAGMAELFEKKLATEEQTVKSRLKLHRGEIFDSKPVGRFSLVVLAFNFLQLAPTRKDRLALLKACHHQLINRGKLYAEVSMPHADFVTPGRSGRRFVKTFYDRNRRMWTALFQSHEYNPASQELLMEYTYLYMRNDGMTEKITRFASLSIVYPMELEGLIEESGFRVRNVWGGFSREPLSPDSTRILLLAEKP